MNAIRLAISVFLLVIVVTSVLGFRWAEQAGQPIGGRVVLALGAAGALFALKELWTARRRGAH